MSASESAGWRRVPIQFAVAAAVVTGIGGAFAGAAIANDDGDATMEPAAAGSIQAERTSTQVQAAEQAQLRAIVVKMPSGWTATEVMWRGATQPQNDTSAVHHDWRHAATLMPSGWPATDAMRQAATQPQRDAGAHHDWRHAATRMPSGWPATDAMRRTAEQPRHDTAALHDWRHAATLMPSGWPATDVMRRAAADGAR